jgi:hypothetical protein
LGLMKSVVVAKKKAAAGSDELWEDLNKWNLGNETNASFWLWDRFCW